MNDDPRYEMIDRVLREDGLTPTTLARRLGLKVSSRVSNWRNRESPPSFESLIEVARATGRRLWVDIPKADAPQAVTLTSSEADLIATLRRLAAAAPDEVERTTRLLTRTVEATIAELASLAGNGSSASKRR